METTKNEDTKQYEFNEDGRAEGVSLKCLNCGASLKFDPESQMFVCESCGSSFSKEKLSSKLSALSEESENTEYFDEESKEYHCPSCGANILVDENSTAEFCAYCGNPVVLSGRVSGQIKPSLIIPFKINKEGAKKALFDQLKSYGFVPKSFFKDANLDKVTGIYYPFWEADADTHCSIKATGTKTRSWVSGNRKYTKVSYYDVYRAGDIHFEDITVNALKSADKVLVEGILPYPIKEHEKFSRAYLSGFYSKKNDLSFDDIKPEIDQKMNSYSTTILKNTIKGYGTVTVDSNSVNVKSMSKDYVYLPVWILNYKYKNKDYKFSINGSTGKIFGDLPLSKGKLALTMGGLFAGLFTAIVIIGGLL